MTGVSIWSTCYSYCSIYPFVRVGFCIAVFISFAIQFYVPTERMEKFIQRKLYRGDHARQLIAMYGARVAMIVVCCEEMQICCKHLRISVAIAELVPHLGLVISLIGAYGSSSLALLFPAIIDLLTERAQTGTVRMRTAIKDGLLFLVAMVAIGTGTYAALDSIVKTF